jgi:hypothetical protein
LHWRYSPIPIRNFSPQCFAPNALPKYIAAIGRSQLPAAVTSPLRKKRASTEVSVSSKKPQPISEMTKARRER